MANHIHVDPEDDDEILDAEDMVELDDDGLEDDAPSGDMGEERERDTEEGMEGEEEASAAPLVDDAVHVFTGHTDSVYSVAFSPSPPTRVASGGGDEVAYLWTVCEETDPSALRGHTDSVSVLSFSGDGALLASGGLDGLVQVWDATSAQLRHTLDGPGGGVEWLSWHPKGHVVLAGSEDFSVWMWNADSGVCMGVFTGHSGDVSAGMFTPDGKLVVTGSADASVKIWDPKSTSALHTLGGHSFHSEAVTCLDTRLEGGVGVSGSTDKTAVVFSWHAGKAVGKLSGHRDSVECVGLHPSLPILATGSPDKQINLWDLNSLQLRSSCPHHDGIVQLAWHPIHPATLVAACADGSVHLWDGRSGSSERTLMGHREAILSMSISKDGRYVLTGSDDKTCRVFDLSS